MKPAILLCFLLLAVPAYARLGETSEQIQARYGKPARAKKPESPATDAEVYEKNGFQITVGYYEGKSYYEEFRKFDPGNPNSLLEITETERDWLAKANGLSPMGRMAVQAAGTQDGLWMLVSHGGPQDELWMYISPDRLSEGGYSLKVLTIRSLRIEKRKEADEKKRQEENLKDF